MDTSPSVETVTASGVQPEHRKFNITVRAVDFIVGGIFIYAGAIKALNPIQFAIDIDNYKILPWAFGVRLAFYLPWLEILCGAALITRRLYLGGLSVLTALVAVFMVGSISAKARGIDITCGCFGHASKNLSFTWHLTLVFILLLALIFLLRNISKTRVEPEYSSADEAK
jgi:putative oxidoreductase